MPRPQLYPEDAIMDAARAVVSRTGCPGRDDRCDRRRQWRPHRLDLPSVRVRRRAARAPVDARDAPRPGGDARSRRTGRHGAGRVRLLRARARRRAAALELPARRLRCRRPAGGRPRTTRAAKPRDQPDDRCSRGRVRRPCRARHRAAGDPRSAVWRGSPHLRAGTIPPPQRRARLEAAVRAALSGR